MWHKWHCCLHTDCNILNTTAFTLWFFANCAMQYFYCSPPDLTGVPLWTSTCSMGLIAQHTPFSIRWWEFRFQFESVFTSRRSRLSFVSYCFVSSSYSFYPNDRQSRCCCLLFVLITINYNKLISVPKSELYFICVRGLSWGIQDEWYCIPYRSISHCRIRIWS